MIHRTTSFFKKYPFVISILFLSSILRWILILRGGQFYFPDESRYGIAQDALALLLEGKVRTALLTLVGELAHVGFKVTALIPALFENLFGTTLAFPAIFFSFFSILSLFLIWEIALKAGAAPIVANYALLFAACSQALLYYSRHLFPYDQAIFFGLLALYVALVNPNKPGISFLCGALSFFCLVTYNGYWAIAAFPMIVNLFNGAKEKHWMVKRPFFLGLGFLTPLILLLMVCFVVGKDFFSDYALYLQKITQGSFDEGWSLPFEYFWHAEHGFILILGVFSLVALFFLLRNRNTFLSIAFGGILFIYLCLVIPSNFTHTFVVYGRTARQLMPFLALTAAYGLSNLHAWKPAGHWLVNIVFVLTLVQAVWNYRLSYQNVYPREFVQDIQEQYPDFKISENMMRFYAPLICQNNGLLLMNAHYIYTWTDPLPVVQGNILLRASHPINFLPHQFDGFSLQERQAIRQENFEMVLYKPDASYLATFGNAIENCNQAKNNEE